MRLTELDFRPIEPIAFVELTPVARNPALGRVVRWGCVAVIVFCAFVALGAVAGAWLIPPLGDH